MRWASVNPPSKRREQVYLCFDTAENEYWNCFQYFSISISGFFFIFLFVYIFSVNTLLALFILKNAIE